MNRANLRLKVGAFLAAATIVGAGAVATVAVPAGASNRQVTAAGSFTTYQLMHALFPTSLNDLLPGGTTSHQRVIATTTYCASTTPSTKVYGIRFTTATKYPGGAPNGSSAGKNFLKKTEETTTAFTKKGCVTIGRSSSPPTPKTVSTHFDYYAYALDGIAAMLGSNAGGSPERPVAIKLQQIKNIYACWKLTLPGTTVATHAVTTWKQAGVSTSTQTINRFWPQSGAGTRATFLTILGFTPSKTATVPHCPSPAPTAFDNVTVKGTPTANVPNEENTESGLIYATKVMHESLANDIYIYSGGKFVSEWNNQITYGTAKNNRIDQSPIGNFTSKGLQLASIQERKVTGATTPHGAIEPFVHLTHVLAGGRTSYVAGLNAAAVSESNEWFSHIPSNADAGSESLARVPGVRYVYNVCDTSLPGYDVCKAMVGFDNQTIAYTHSLTVVTAGEGLKSRLCAGDDAAVIAANGFLPLPVIGGPRGSNRVNSTCREFPGDSYPGLATAPKTWVANTWVNPTK